jgi:enterochelin esterase-like enzyme
VIPRRRFLLGVAAGALAACSRNEKSSSGPSQAGPSPPPAPQPEPPRPATPTSTRLLQWDFAGGPSSRAVIVVPKWGDAATRFPVLVAMHGRGEAVKPPEEGAMGWPRDYALTRAVDRLRAPPLTADDYEGFVDPARMAQLNADLAARAFGGLIVACPHVPDMDPNGGDVRAVARFVIDVLLPRVRAETPALSAPESTGIDGVSMGGALALRIGLSSPEAFGAVGALQPAIAPEMADELTEMARGARARRPGMRLRLLTSYGDYFHDAVTAASDAWTAGGVDHDFADVPGPHDYAFNRGPGSIEMLAWHDRALVR